MKARPFFPGLFISALLLFIQGSGPPEACADELSVRTYTRTGPFLLSVRFKEGKKEWAQSILDEAPPYIRKVERFMKTPIWWDEFMIIQGCDNCTSRAELQDHKIYLDYRYSTPEDVSVLFHEINHFWFYYNVNRSSEEWLIEGIASFLPNIMRDKHILPDKPLYHEVIDRYWGLDWPLSSDLKDVPLYPFNEKKRSLLYWKSYKLQYIFYCMMGEKRYANFVRKISRMRRRKPSTVISTLLRYKRANWKRVLKGWVLGQEYKGISLQDFTEDVDSDGLCRAKELCFRTDPEKHDTDSDSLPDGAEAAIHRNPRKPDRDAPDLLARYGPFADGSDTDWGPIQAAVSKDLSGDVQGPAWADMNEMWTAVRNDNLYVLVKTASSPENSEKVFFDILVDTNGDYYTDEEFAFWLHAPLYSWHYSVAAGSSSSLNGLGAAAGDYLEMAIPLSAIPSQSFSILPIIRDNETNTNFDEWVEWVPLNK